MRKSVDLVNHQATPRSRGASVAVDLLELVHAVMHAHRSLQYRILRDGPHAISHMEGKVLGFFGAHPGATQRDLVQRSGRDKAQLARLVKTLRDLGLLTGEVDPADRRNLHLSLTAEGQAVRRALDRQGEHLAERALAGLTADEQAQLRSLLGRVSANLRDPGPGEPA